MISSPPPKPTVCSEKPSVPGSEAYNLLDSYSAKSEFSCLGYQLQDRTSDGAHSSSYNIDPEGMRWMDHEKL